jgi:cystathionine beta-synthase
MAMKGALPHVLGAIGNTPIVALQRLGANVYVKCEHAGPSGSRHERSLLAALDAAALTAGRAIIHASRGDSGVALAMIAAVRGYACTIVVPDTTSREKRAAIAAFGASVVACPSTLDPDDARGHRAVAERLARETPNAFLLRDRSEDAVALADEIWAQTGGELDVVCIALSASEAIGSLARTLKEKKLSIRVVGIDPVGSVLHDAALGRTSQPFAYAVEEIGESYVPSTLELGAIDEVVRVDDQECFTTARSLAREEGLFVGGAGGAVVAGALKIAAQRAKAETVLALCPDSGWRYLSTIYDDDWMREHGFLPRTGHGVVADLLAQKSDEIITAHPTDRVRDVIARMKAHGISQLPVVDDGRLVGAVAEVDLLRYLVSGEHSLESAVGPLSESDYATVSRRTSIETLKGLLEGARMAIVTEEQRIVGVVTKIDLIDFLARRRS